VQISDAQPNQYNSKVSPVVERPVRRTYSADYKRRILKEADEGPVGTTGALLRREGLYSSHLTTWREQRARGERAGLTAQKRGPKPDAFAIERGQLRHENAQLKAELERARTVIEVQKKVVQLLGLLPMNSAAAACETGGAA
jgi:transposase-like protein